MDPEKETLNSNAREFIPRSVAQATPSRKLSYPPPPHGQTHDSYGYPEGYSDPYSYPLEQAEYYDYWYDQFDLILCEIEAELENDLKRQAQVPNPTAESLPATNFSMAPAAPLAASPTVSVPVAAPSMTTAAPAVVPPASTSNRGDMRVQCPVCRVGTVVRIIVKSCDNECCVCLERKAEHFYPCCSRINTCSKCTQGLLSSA